MIRKCGSLSLQLFFLIIVVPSCKREKRAKIGKCPIKGGITDQTLSLNAPTPNLHIWKEKKTLEKMVFGNTYLVRDLGCFFCGQTIDLFF